MEKRKSGSSGSTGLVKPIGLGVAATAAAGAAGELAKNTTRLSGDFGNVGKVLGIGENTVTVATTPLTTTSGTFPMMEDKYPDTNPESGLDGIPDTTKTIIEKITKVKAFLPNHSKFEIHVKASSPSKGTAVEEKLELTSKQFSTILNILEKI